MGSHYTFCLFLLSKSYSSTTGVKIHPCIIMGLCDNDSIQSTDCIIDYNCYNNTQCIMQSLLNQNTISKPGVLFLSVFLFSWHPAGQIQQSIIFIQTYNWFWWIRCTAWYIRELSAHNQWRIQLRSSVISWLTTKAL